MKYLYFPGEINRARIEWLLRKLREPGRDTVVINSPGGQFEFFSTLGPPLIRRGITTVGMTVESAAVLLYLLGHRRLALPNATFFFHDVRVVVGRNGEITLTDAESLEAYTDMMSKRERDEFEAWLSSMRNAQRWLADTMAQHTGVTSGTLMDLMHGERRLNAFEARRYGIVHEIVPSIDHI